MADRTPSSPAPLMRCLSVDASARERKRHVALVPGDAVPLIRLDLPDRLRGQAREQVARRQLVDMLGPEAEAMHVLPFAIADAPERWDRVMVATRGQVAAWRDRTGKRCAAVLPDYLSLPAAPGVWVVASDAEGGMMRARFGVADGASGPEAVLALMAGRLIAEGGAPARVLNYGPPLPVFEARLAALDVPVETVGEATPDLPQGFAHGELSLDLRADPHAARRRLARTLRAWGLPLVAALVAASLWGSAQLVALRALEREIAEVQTQTRDVVRDVFALSGPILDVRIQVARALAEQRAAVTGQSETPAAFDLFAAVAPVLAAQGAQVDRVTGQSDGRLRLLLGLADFAAVETLVQSLSDAAMIVTLEDARLAEAGARGGRVTADLILAPNAEQGG